MGERTWKWTPEKEWVAELVAARDYNYSQIARKTGITRQTIAKWVADPDFDAKVKELTGERAEAIRSVGIALPEKRLEALHDRWTRLRQIMDERGEDPAMKAVPGGRTGLLVRRAKQIGSGENASVEYEYELDAALLREMREHEVQAARELGQWEGDEERLRPLVDMRQQLFMLSNPRAAELVCQYDELLAAAYPDALSGRVCPQGQSGPLGLPATPGAAQPQANGRSNGVHKAPPDHDAPEARQE